MNKSVFETGSFHICLLHLSAVLIIVIIANIIIIVVISKKHLSNMKVVEFSDEVWVMGSLYICSGFVKVSS